MLGEDSGILFLCLLPCFAPNSPPIMKVQPRSAWDPSMPTSRVENQENGP